MFLKHYNRKTNIISTSGGLMKGPPPSGGQRPIIRRWSTGKVPGIGKLKYIYMHDPVDTISLYSICSEVCTSLCGMF